MKLFDLDYGIELPNGERIHAISSKKNRLRSLYKYFSADLDLILSVEGNSPLTLTKQSQVGKLIFKSLPAKSNSKRLFGEICEALAEFQDYYETQIEEIERQKREEREQQHKRELDGAMGIYDGLDNPIQYIGSCVDWITAGERANILISFFTLCSQVVLRHPISLIGIGEGSSGKNHVCESALSMIPSEFIVMEKKPTLASMFRRAEEDPHYYDGKIVVYGDMGGDSDQEDVEETKNILKELQTDGKVNRPVTVKTSDGFEVVDLCLIGNPCLVYQTVPNYSFDDQELSRSMLVTPRTDNRAEYTEMLEFLEYVGGGTHTKHTQMKSKLTTVVPLIVEGLRNKFEDILIVNPYIETVEKFVGEDNPHYKRDLPKLNSILKVITAFNSNTREIYEVNGRKVMFTNKEDVSLFLSLFKTYGEAISHNLTKKATEIFHDIREHLDDWTYRSEDDMAVFDAGITTSRYHEVGNVKDLSLRSIQRYFSELKEKSFLTVVGNVGRSSIYSLSEREQNHMNIKVEDLSEESQRIFRNEYNSQLLDLILHDSSNCRSDVHEQHSSISIPPWMVKE